MRNRDGIFGYPVGPITGLAFAALVVVFVTILAVAPSQAQDAQVDINESVNDSFNTDVTIDAQSQECAAIVQQFNDASAGDAVSQNEAVAATAAAVDAPVNVVQSCLQADGDVVIGSGNDDGNDDGNVTEEASDGQEDADDGTVKNDSTSAAQEQYGDTTSAGQEDSCAVALDPEVTVAENGEASEELNIESGQEGDYRVTYDLGEETERLRIELDGGSGSTAPISFDATEDGSRIEVLGAQRYTVTVTPNPGGGDGEGGYTVEVSRCGASSNNPDNTMNNTYDNGKQLANTGGPTETSVFASPSAVLIPFGVALVISGVIAAFWLRNASNRS